MSGDSFQDIPVLKINVERVIQHITEGVSIPETTDYSHVNRLQESDLLTDSIKRASALTEFIEKGMVDREVLWDYLNDESSIVRKTVISFGLGASKDENERALYGEHFYSSKKETGEEYLGYINCLQIHLVKN